MPHPTYIDTTNMLVGSSMVQFEPRLVVFATMEVTADRAVVLGLHQHSFSNFPKAIYATSYCELSDRLSSSQQLKMDKRE